MNVTMKRFLPFLFFLCYATFAQAQNYIPQIVYVKLDDSASKNMFKQSKFDALQEISATLNVKIELAIDPQKINSLKNRRVLKSSLDVVSAFDELAKWYKVELPFSEDALQFVNKWRNKRGISRIEPHYIRELTDVPNDPIYFGLVNNYYEKQQFTQAWDIQKSDATIVIAIVDSGVDYTHSDLSAKLWKNTNEIPNNGIDDDENGWVDDTMGWDFWQGGQAGPGRTQDNNPMGEFSDHGTHVAGIAAAQTNNGIGLPGAGYNSNYMAIKAGGTSDNPRSIGYGYEGMLYAAANGADVINCSWGGGGFSYYELDIVKAVLASGCVIVAAAGNDNVDSEFFPAAYDGIISVGSFDMNNKKSGFSNYGYYLDVLASGSSINSTVFTNKFGLKSGTSMASPFVAGLAALVKAQHPNWTPAQIKNQIRVTATDVSASNSISYAGKLGRGYINAEKALGTELPGYVIHNFKLVNGEGGKLKLNQDGIASFDLTSVGKETGTSTLTFSSPTTGVELSQTNVSLNQLAKGASVKIELPIKLLPTFNPTVFPIFKLALENNSFTYQDEIFVVYDELIFEEHNNNKLDVSISADGTIGFVDPLNGSGGVGFIPMNDDSQFDTSDNIMFSSSLIVRHKSRIADRAISQTSVGNDIKPTSFYSITKTGDLLVGEGFARIQAVLFPALTIHTKSYSSSAAEVNQSLITQYTFSNPTSTQVDSIFVGFFTDWDIADYSTNQVKYYAENQLIAGFSSDGSMYAGMALINPISGALAINNAFDGTPTDVDFGIYFDADNMAKYDGFTKAEKLKTMSSGFIKANQTAPTDISMAAYTGPFSIPANDSISVGFIWAYGKSEQELKTQVENAKALNLFSVSTPVGVSIEESDLFTMGESFEIAGNFPNPFNPSTQLRVNSKTNQQVSLRVYDTLGKLVIKQDDVRLNSGEQMIELNFSKLSSGVYFVRIQNSTLIKQHAVLLIK